MRKLKDEQKGVFFIALIFIIICTATVIFSFTLDTNTVKESLKGNQLEKILFIVEDKDDSALLSNVMIYDMDSKKAAMINIPGYTGSIYKSLGRVDKIKNLYKEVGVETYKEEIEKLLGISIPFYVIFELDDFLTTCDYLGGFRIFISEPVDTTDEDGKRYLLPSGAVNLDGDKVDSYLHYTLDIEDQVDVQERFQNIMAAYISSLHDKSFQVFADKNFERYASLFRSNITTEEELTLLKPIADMDTESIIRQTITGSMRNVDGQQVLFPLNNGENVRNNVKQAENLIRSSNGTVTSRVYVLEIQNGTSTQGLARNTSILFQNASYDVLSAVNADRNDYEHTIIIDHIGNEDAAKMIGEFIHCTNIQQADSSMEEEDNSRANVDFTIILGKDFNGQYVVNSGASK